MDHRCGGAYKHKRQLAIDRRIKKSPAGIQARPYIIITQSLIPLGKISTALNMPFSPQEMKTNIIITNSAYYLEKISWHILCCSIRAR